MNPKRYPWSELVYKKVASKILEFRRELNQVSTQEVCRILGVPDYIYTRLGNESYWFTQIPQRHWETLYKASNNLFIEAGVIKDHGEKPVKIIQIDDLKTKKLTREKKTDSSPSPDDSKVRTYTDPKSRKEVHVTAPEDVSEINAGDQETSMDKADVEIVTKETLEFTPEGKQEAKIDLEVRVGNFVWVDKENGIVNFVECPDGKFKVYEDMGVLFPVGTPQPDGGKYKTASDGKGIWDTYKGIGAPGPSGVNLSAKALMEIDDQVRRIIKEEVPGIVEKAINNIKFEIELPVKIKS